MVTENPRESEIRDLTDEEYERTYSSGSGGHELPQRILELLSHEEPVDE